MNQLLVKIKNRLRNEKAFKKIVSGESCFSMPENMITVNYDPNTILDEFQWFVINNFSEQSFSISLTSRSEFNSVEFSKMNLSEFNKIDYICSVEGDNLFFQKVFPSQLVVKKRLFHLGDDFKYEPNNVSLVINKYPDAIYSKTSDKLFFKKLESIITIFKGIDILYRESTSEEVEEFISNDFISNKDRIKVEDIGRPMRKKMAIAIKVLSGFSQEEKIQVLEYTKKKSGLHLDNGNFVVSNEKDLEKLLLGIQERYYETPVSKEQRVANSIIKIENL